jgi:hypothetical protein
LPVLVTDFQPRLPCDRVQRTRGVVVEIKHGTFQRPLWLYCE